jgi:peptidoglycan/LPS O-acetylase OafA/YrhL
MAPTRTSTRFVALDSWRGVCALLVAVHNAGLRYDSSFVRHSSLFVDFFFILSGFVITHAYQGRFQSLSELGSFVLRRFGRLWPLHFALLIAFVGYDLLKLVLTNFLHAAVRAAPFQGDNSVVSLIQNALLMQSVGLHSHPSWNVPSWSVSTEFWTYLVFAFICFVSSPRRPSKVFIAALVLLAASVIMLYSPDALETNSDYAILRCIYGFFVGHLIYRAWETGAAWDRAGTLLEITALVTVIAFVSFLGTDIWSIAAPFVFGFAVWVFAQENGRVSNLLMTRPLVQLGVWSYSIYMVHWFIMTRVYFSTFVPMVMGRPANLGESMPFGNIWTEDAFLAGYLLFVVAVASITYKFIEQPSRRFFNRLSDKLT